MDCSTVRRFLYVSMGRLSTLRSFFFFFNDTATTEIYTLSLHDALPISLDRLRLERVRAARGVRAAVPRTGRPLAGVARGWERAGVGGEQPRAVLPERHQDDGRRDRPAPHVHHGRPARTVPRELPERSRLSQLRRDA